MKNEPQDKYWNEGTRTERLWVSFRKINDKLSYLNTVILIVLSLNIIISFVMSALFLVGSIQYRVYDFFSNIYINATSLVVIAVVMPLMLCVGVIMFLVVRELTLRDGRALFEVGAEYGHKGSRLNKSILGSDDRAIYIEIRRFAINENLPFTIQKSKFGALLYIQMSVISTAFFYATLFYSISRWDSLGVTPLGLP